MKHVLKALLIITGAALCLYSGFLSSVSNFNLGVAMPAVLGLPMLSAGIFYKKLAPVTKSGWGRLLKLFIIGCYSIYIIIFTLTSALICNSAAKAAPAGADVLIVLGAGVQGDRPSLTLLRRLDTSYSYLISNPETVVIVTGGRGEQESVTEAQAMADYLISRGISPERIIKEEKASSTEENFKYSKALIEQKFGQDVSVAFITSDFHVFRAERVAMRQGLDAQGIASPSVCYMLPSFYLRETVAVWVYYLRGWL